MKYRVQHKTTYSYDDFVVESHHSAHLCPRSLPHQLVEDYRLLVNPTPTHQGSHTDVHGNLVELLHIHQPHRQLEVCAESVVTCSRKNLPQVIPVEIDSSLEDWQRSCASQWQLAEFLLPSPHTQPLAELQAWASTWLAPRRSVFQALRDLTQAIHQNFAYAPGSTHINTPLSTVFTQRSGVCQDFAHLMLSALRSAGIPARYVSGYLETLPPPGQERLVGADASHAWVAAYLPAYGWIDYDPTNNCIVGQAHITVAWGRDYDDVPPLKGIIHGGGEHEVKVAVDVQRLDSSWSSPQVL